MAKPDFQSVLDKTPDEIERPRPLPTGHYITIIKERYTQDKSSQKETPFFEFILHPIEALEDVNEEALSDALTKANGEKRKLSDMSIRARFFDTPDAEYRLKKFLLEDCALSNDGTIGQIMDNTIGCQVIAHVKHRMFGDDVFLDLKSTAPMSSIEQPKKAAAKR